MRVALFIPCYVDQLRPEVGVATLGLLESLGCEVIFRPEVTCCGQPFLTAGETAHAARLAGAFTRLLGDCDTVVIPSGSCAATVRGHFERLTGSGEAAAIAAKTTEQVHPENGAPFQFGGALAAVELSARRGRR